MKTVLKYLLAILLASIVIGTPVLVLTGALPYKIFVIHTGSMTPTVPVGSIVEVKEHEYSVGQIISFNINDEIVTHRLISIKDGRLTTKGDGNPTPDPLTISRSQVIGGVVAQQPYLGYAAIALTDPDIDAGLLCWAIVFYLVWSIMRPDENKIDGLSFT